MSGNIRKEAIDSLYREIALTGQISQVEGERVQAVARLIADQQQEERSRALALRTSFPRDFDVGIYGSARLKKGDPEFDHIVEVSKSLVLACPRMGIASGGGPGVMEAANYGVMLARFILEQQGIQTKSKSIGVVINSLPHQEEPNPYLDIRSNHLEFSTRLQYFMDRTKGAYFAPGGIGTGLELMMILQCLQVNHLDPNFKVVADPYWKPYIDTLNDVAYHKRNEDKLTPLISEEDLNLIGFTNGEPDERIYQIADIFSKSYDVWETTFHQKLAKKPSLIRFPTIISSQIVRTGMLISKFGEHISRLGRSAS